MKKNSLIIILLLTYVFPRDISPVISIRYDQINDEIAITDAIGLKFKLDDKVFNRFSPECKDVLSKILLIDPLKRINIQ